MADEQPGLERLRARLQGIKNLRSLSVSRQDAVAAVTIVGLIQSAGIAQRYANPDGSRQDDSKDFVAQGVANVAGGFFQTMPSDDVTVLDVYGSMCFAGARSLADKLPSAQEAHDAVAILRLRGHERDIGSTFLDVAGRYAQDLTENGGKLVLSGVSPSVKDRLVRTGAIETLGEENIFLETPDIGYSSKAACLAAREWLAEQARQRTTAESPEPPEPPEQADLGVSAESERSV
jgi:MFS superfamily sulfate permease-like transporter